MATRLKEEEKNERVIRNLLKLPDNRRCINCNSLGPQYVCTNFWTFICTNCSGIHREFTHRVKSVSMAKFTSQEVSSLQGGGNASAKEIYLKEWDSQRNSLPDGSNAEKLRNFIKHVYVDRRYTGEKSFDKPSKTRMGETEKINEDRRLDAYQGGSRSPPYAGGRSPGYNQEKKQQGDFRRSPARPEVINDWRRGDRFGQERKSDEGRISDGFSSEGKSPDLQKDIDVSSPPEVIPIRDILGDNVIPLQVIEPPKAENNKSLGGILRNERTASTNSLASSNGHPAELKTETSLIDFDAAPEPPVTVSVPQTQQSVTSVPVRQQETPFVVDNWANFGAAPEAKASQSSSISNPLDFMMSELSAPTSLTGDGVPFMATSVDNAAFIGVSASPVMSQLDGFSLGGILAAADPAPMPALSANSGFANATSAGQFNNVQQDQVHSIPSGYGSLPTLPPSTQGMGMPPALKATSEAGGRKELPEDLFMASFPSWETGTQYGSGVNLHYNMQTPLPTLQPLNSANPFDVGNERPSVPAPTFPSMTSLQGVLPSMETPSSLLHPSSDGAHLATWMPQQPSHAVSYSSVLPGPYSGPGDMLLTSQGIAGLGFEGSGLGAVNLNQQQGGFYSAHQSTPSSIGGNPFG